MDDLRQMIVDQVPHLRRYARALTNDPDGADDLVQDCLVRGMDRLHLWRPGSNMRAWLFSILHNQYVNTARRRARRPDGTALTDGHEALRATPGNQSRRHEVRDVDRALAELPDEQRQVVLLVGLEGLSYAEVAEVLAIPMGTVMSRLNRGRQRLREIMDSNDTRTLRRVK